MIQYSLRINDTTSNHSGLILKAIRPAVTEICRELPTARVAIRPHWLHGPHILVGYDVSEGREGRIGEILQDRVGRYLAQSAPAKAIDVEAYCKMSARLAKAEKLWYAPEPLHRPATIESGIYHLPLPFGERCLAQLRDDFKSLSLTKVFELTTVSARSVEQAILACSYLFCLLHRLRWIDDLLLWPLSPRGQAIAGCRLVGASLQKVLPEMSRLVGQLKGLLDVHHVFDRSRPMNEADREWIALLQQTYDGIAETVMHEGNEIVERVWRNSTEYRIVPEILIGLSSSRMSHILKSSTHFCYRVLVNLFYEMLPCIGLTAFDRLKMCYVVTKTLEVNYAHIMDEAKVAGSGV